MGKLIAKRNILYDGKQYKVGEELPTYNSEMVKLWIEYDSAAWENEDKSEEDVKTEEAKPKPARKAKGDDL